MDLENKVIIITGGLGGIGFATVQHLLRNNARFVGIIDLFKSESEIVTNHTNELKREFDEHKFKYYQCNLRNIIEFTGCYDEILQEMGHVDILINNAGIINDNDVEAIVAVNFAAVVNNTMAAIKRMDKSKVGVIVNIGSNLGLINAPSAMPVYNATKHAVVSFVRSMKEHNKTLGVRIVCLCPGPTNTEMIMNSKEEWKKNFFDFIDMSFENLHLQSPESVAASIVEIIEKGKEGDVWYAYNDVSPFAVGQESDVDKLKIPF